MKTCIRDAQKGFTLLEMVLVLVIVAVLSFLGSQMLASGLRAYTNSATLASTDNQAGLAWLRIIRELREARSLPLLAANQLQFTTYSGETIRYYQNSDYLMRQQDIATAKPIAFHLERIWVFYYDAAGSPTTNSNDVRFIHVALRIARNGQSQWFSSVIYLPDLR